MLQLTVKYDMSVKMANQHPFTPGRLQVGSKIAMSFHEPCMHNCLFQ